jgi:hypothetical protein
MARQNLQPTTTSTDGDGTRGPQLLEDRSVAGILVHFIAIPTGAVGAGLVYLLASTEFTKRNARNALDWHLTVMGLTVVTFGSLFIYAEGTGQGFTEMILLPSSVLTGAGIVIPGLLILWSTAMFFTFVAGLVAMGKAVFGSAWRYPLSFPFVDRYGAAVAVDTSWPLLIAVYAVLLPVIMASVFVGPDRGAGFLLSTAGLVGLVLILTPMTVAVLYLHGHRDRPQDADWQPRVVAYIGFPVGFGVLGYGSSRLLTDSVSPSGDGMYVFLAALWISAAVYLARWWTTADGTGGSQR